MITYTVDASLVVKFLLNDDIKVYNYFVSILKKAKFSEVRLISSNLLPLEVGNALRYTITNKTLLQETLITFFELPIEFVELDRRFIEKSVSVAFELGTTVYDTSYHILAKSQNATFITCDENYFKKAKNLENIKLI